MSAPSADKHAERSEERGPTLSTTEPAVAGPTSEVLDGGGGEAGAHGDLAGFSLSRVLQLALVAFCGVLPVLVVATIYASTAHDGIMAIDFRQFYRGAEAIRNGVTPYPAPGASLEAWAHPYVYPPLAALATIPLTVLPLHVAEVLAMTCAVVAVLAILYVLGVRDWRCYGIVLVWPPAISVIQTANPTVLLALATALAWRYRGKTAASTASVGVTFGVKFLLWPLVIWLAATRRLAAAALSCVLGAGLLVLSWAVIGFDGFDGYPSLLHRLDGTVGRDAYTTYNLAIELGASPGVARAVWLSLGLLLLAAVVVVGRRGDERNAFILAIAAALSLTPLEWLHYFTLLVVVVALVQPRLGVLWFVPLGMVVSAGSGHPTLFQLSVTIALAAATIVLALRASGQTQRALVVPRIAPA